MVLLSILVVLIWFTNSKLDNGNRDAPAPTRKSARSETHTLYDKAISDYTEAISLNPNFAFAYDNRGLALLKQGNIGLFRQSETPWLHWAGVSVGYEHLGLFARCPTL